MKIRTPLFLMTAALALAYGSALATEIPAASIDSGLGELPPYGEWQDHPALAHLVVGSQVAGEKLDSGLGELPAYHAWRQHPELAHLVIEGGVAGEKLDSGLGELPQFSEWKNDPELSRLARGTDDLQPRPIALRSR